MNRVQSTSREVSLIIKVALEEAGARSAIDTLTKLQALAQQTEQAVARVETASSTARAGARSAQAALKELVNVDRAASSLVYNLRSVQELLQALGQPDLARGVDVLREAGLTIEQLASLQPSVQSLPDLIKQLAQSLGTSSAGLIASLGAFGAAAVALAAALGQVINTIAEGRSRVAGAVDNLRQYFQLTESGTEEQLRARIEDLEQQRRTAELTLEVVRQSRAQLVEQYQNADFFNKTLLLTSGAFEQLDQEIGDLEEEITSLGREIGILEQALARVAERTRELIPGFLALQAVNERRAQIELQTAIQLGEMTAEQARARVRQIEHEIDVISRLIDQGRFSGEALERLGERIADLGFESGLLQEALSGVLRAREREAERIEASRRLLRERAKLEENIQRLQQKRIDAERDFKDAVQKAIEIRIKGEQEIAQLELEKNEKIQEANAAAAEQLIKLQQQTAKAREKIERDFARASANAIASRDALAFVMARQARNDQLKNLEEQYAEQEQTIQESLQKQLTQIEQSYSKQIRLTQERTAQELQAQFQEVLRRRETLVQINNDLSRALQQEQTIRNLYLTLNQQALQNAFQGMYQQIVTFGQNAVSALQTIFAQAALNTPISSSPPLSGGSGVGGVGGSFGFSPTRFSPSVSAAGLGARSITINVQGATARQVTALSRREAIRVFDSVLDDLLFE